MRSSETNMEHYRNKILEILKNGYHDFSLRKDGSFASCGGMNCDDCVFGAEKTKVNCCKAKTLWMMEEYKPEITLTAREKHFVEFVESGYIARDESGRLYWYGVKPKREFNHWYNKNDEVYNIYEFDGMFTFITWEDEQPWSVEELRKLKVQDA